MGESLRSETPVNFDALTVDGAVVHIRMTRPDDAPELRSLHERVSDESYFRRFFQGSRRAGLDYVARLLVKSQTDDLIALVALLSEKLVAVASFERVGAHEAEIALLVDDAYHGRGIGTLLLEELIRLARQRQIGDLEADILGSNGPMLRVLRGSALAMRQSVESGVVSVHLSTEPAEVAMQAVDQRERIAEERSLGPVLAPRTVAVIGAGRQPGGVGHDIFRNILDGGFTGQAFAVNPHADFVAGVPSYPAIGAVPQRVDLAVLAVPAEQVPEVISECAKAGVRGAVVVSSGLGEAGEHGAALQRQMLSDSRSGGMRVIGPNCLGIVNTDPGVSLNATFASCTPSPGTLALASQSGAVGIAVLNMAAPAGLGLSEFVSLGNKADVSGNDLLLHWWRHPRTRAIALYLESFGNPRKFARLARRVGRDKPVLVVKGGRSPGGLRAGSSHTAAAASSETAVEALFTQSGVVRVDTIGELLDAARVMVSEPLPNGNRLGIIGNAGGAGVLAADAAAAAGLEVTEISESTRARLRELAPESAGLDNPIDLGAGCTGEQISGAVGIMAASGEIDALLVIITATRSNSADEAAVAVDQVLAGRSIPAVLTLLGVPATGSLERTHLPCFSLPEPAVRALGRLSSYGRWRRRDAGTVPSLPDCDLGAVSRTVRSFLLERPEGAWVGPELAAELMRHAGMTFSQGSVVRDIRQAARAAGEFGYPVVVKAADPALVHKSDVGAVQTGLMDRHALREAVKAVSAAARSAGCDSAVLVQPFVAGIEFAIGMVHEPPFGPVLMLSAGGVLIDILDDRTWRIPPLTDVDAEEMVDSLRSARLLAGYRGAPKVDRAGLVDLLHRVGQMVDAVPEITELDLNPVIVTASGAIVVDAKIRLAAAAQEPDPFSRHLR